jgi:ankyrin repeat protein
MTLEMEKLRVEARERDEYEYCPLNYAALNAYPLRVVQQLQLAYPAGVNYRRGGHVSALMIAASKRNAELVDLLCEMGSCIGYRDAFTANAFDHIAAITYPYDDDDDEDAIAKEDARREAKEIATRAAFKKHGVWRSIIPADYISPLYFKSSYFTKRVGDTNWAQFGTILMCMEEIDVKYRKFGEKALNHLSKEARNFYKVFTCVDGTDRLGNGIARLMLTFIGGENTRERLKGVPLDPKL